jgi:hypothetical protein
LVAQNRLEWANATQAAITKTGYEDMCRIHHDAGFSTTALLLRETAYLLNDKALFIYGHAPRHSEHLAKLRSALEFHALAISGVRSSSRRDLIISGTLYLEPPVALDLRRLDLGAFESWRSVWQAHKRGACVIDTNGPGEFNIPNERLRFEAVGFLSGLI